MSPPSQDEFPPEIPSRFSRKHAEQTQCPACPQSLIEHCTDVGLRCVFRPCDSLIALHRAWWRAAWRGWQRHEDPAFPGHCRFCRGLLRHHLTWCGFGGQVPILTHLGPMSATEHRRQHRLWREGKIRAAAVLNLHTEIEWQFPRGFRHCAQSRAGG